MATRHLARPDSTVLGLIGAGALAHAHLAAIRHVRPIDTVLVWSRTRATAEEFARATTGLHVNAVGAPPRPDHREIDSEAVRRSRLVVDTIHTATTESGAVVIPLTTGELERQHVGIELGDVVTGRRPGRTSPADITLFNSVGLPIQDLATAHLVLEAARLHHVGHEIDLTGSLTRAG